MRKFIFLLIICHLSCEADDSPSAPDINLFLGTWKLQSSIVDSSAITLSECEQESVLILWWFNEFDPACCNAEIYDYEIDANGNCIISENVINAFWISQLNFDNNGNYTSEVKLKYTLGNAEVELDMVRDGEFLIVRGSIPNDGEMDSIVKTYRKLRQEVP